MTNPYAARYARDAAIKRDATQKLLAKRATGHAMTMEDLYGRGTIENDKQDAKTIPTINEIGSGKVRG